MDFDENDLAAKFAEKMTKSLIFNLSLNGLTVESGSQYNRIFDTFYNLYKPEPDKPVLQEKLVDLMRDHLIFDVDKGIQNKEFVAQEFLKLI